MAAQAFQRAYRQQAHWPARIRSKGQGKWQDGRVVNLSVTGALLQVDHEYSLGECLEVEIDFLNQPESETVVAGTGYVVRRHLALPNAAAVQFETECSIARRRGDETLPDARPFRDWRRPKQARRRVV